MAPQRPFLPITAAFVAGIYRWSPVWIPLILLWQFASRGLSPALAERDRLRGLTPAVEAGYDDARQAFEELDAEARAWQDPVYQERRRRLRAMEAADRAQARIAQADVNTYIPDTYAAKPEPERPTPPPATGSAPLPSGFEAVPRVQ
ncbi:MAG: hypothetical protein R3F33_17245 [Planctomycetota bacterium]